MTDDGTSRPDEVAMDPLAFVDEWYWSQCDGDWETRHGIRIENDSVPGWAVTVDILGTDIEGLRDSLPHVATHEPATGPLSARCREDRLHILVAPPDIRTALTTFQALASETMGKGLDELVRRRLRVPFAEPRAGDQFTVTLTDVGQVLGCVVATGTGGPRQRAFVVDFPEHSYSAIGPVLTTSLPWRLGAFAARAPSENRALLGGPWLFDDNVGWVRNEHGERIGHRAGFAEQRVGDYYLRSAHGIVTALRAARATA